MAVQQRSRDTRERFIRGAADAFGELGYAAATLDQIARRAGATKGAFYHHFRSKQEVANAVIALQFELAFAATSAAVEQGGTAFEKLVRMSRAFAEQMRDDPVVSAGVRLTTDPSARELDQLPPYDGWIASVAPLAAAAIAEGSLRPDLDPAVVAELIIPTYSGVQMVSDIRTGHADLFEQLRHLWTELLIPGFGAPSRTAELSRAALSILADA